MFDDLMSVYVFFYSKNIIFSLKIYIFYTSARLQNDNLLILYYTFFQYKRRLFIDTVMNR